MNNDEENKIQDALEAISDSINSGIERIDTHFSAPVGNEIGVFHEVVNFLQSISDTLVDIKIELRTLNENNSKAAPMVVTSQSLRDMR